MTGTPDIPTFKGEQVISVYPPPGEGLRPIHYPPTDYGQPKDMYQEPPPDWEPQISYTKPPAFCSSVEQERERLVQINPDIEMPHPLRKCRLCGYKGYGDYFKNHKCRR